MRYSEIMAGMILKLKPSRANDYGLIENTVTVLGLKDRPGYKVGHVFASYLVRDTYGERTVSGYFKPSDFAAVVRFIDSHSDYCIAMNEKRGPYQCECK